MMKSQLGPRGRINLGGAVRDENRAVLAKAIEATPAALVVIIETGSVSIPWEKCSKRLANASWLERSRVELSPSGYGIHWPLVGEDLAIVPLLGLAA
jgi:hypothetical protein